MQRHTILAIDPGASGGLAWGLGTAASPATANMPANASDLASLVDAIDAEALAPIHAFVELVGGFIKSRGKGENEGNPGSAMFAFGQNYGQILGVLAALEIPTTLVRPQKWQAAMSLGNSATHANKSKWKSHLATRAKQLYPKAKITLQTADAVLIWHAAKTERIKP